MAKRMRSPNYPSMPLGQAIAAIERIYTSERTNAVDREVVAQAMGYSGITGRSAKVLSDLIQYGLLDKAGKNEVRVSERAVEILHPDTPESRVEALRAAATEPELFQRVTERFAAGQPSDGALRSFFLREGFTDAAIPSAKRAYLETLQLVQEMIGSESNGQAPKEGEESLWDQEVKEELVVKPQRHGNQSQFGRPSANSRSGRPPDGSPVIDWHNRRVWPPLITSKAEADEAIRFIEAMKAFLPDSPAKDTEIKGNDLGEAQGAPKFGGKAEDDDPATEPGS